MTVLKVIGAVLLLPAWVAAFVVIGLLELFFGRKDGINSPPVVGKAWRAYGDE